MLDMEEIDIDFVNLAGIDLDAMEWKPGGKKEYEIRRRRSAGSSKNSKVNRAIIISSADTECFVVMSRQCGNNYFDGW